MSKAKYQAVLFDLDGTITNPAGGIINAILYSAKEHGLQENKPEELISFIGPPLHLSFQQRYNTSESKAFEMVKTYREYYGKKGIFECYLYDGIVQLIETLHEQGVFLSLATSKPVFYAQQLIEHFQLDAFISFVGGSNMDGSRTDKKEVIAYALDNIPPFSTNDILMIGDREFDIVGGQHFGLGTAWAKWGYGSTHIVSPLAPMYTFYKPLDVLDIFPV